MFKTPAKASLIEIPGCVYSFDTPGSNLRIRFFQSAVGTDVSNGEDFLRFLKPVRELLETKNIKDIKQLVQRELDDVRIIKSLIPYILNQGGILGENGVAFFPSVLGVLMPKDYLKSLNPNYPQLNCSKGLETPESKIQVFDSNEFNWSVKSYKDDNGGMLPFCSLTVDTKNCDIVVIDGQHRVNAFRAANDSMTTDNSVIKQIYDNCPKYNIGGINKVNLPITIIWFENIDESLPIKISPELISRKLFIDVNNTAKTIATSRKILLDDRNPVNLITNQFYSKIAELHGFNLDVLSLVFLGFDVPSEISKQTTFNSLPFPYLTTPERLKTVFDVFFVRSKSYSIKTFTKTKDGRWNKYKASIVEDEFNMKVISYTLSNASSLIASYTDEYLEKKVLYVSDDLIAAGVTKQDGVRLEFDNLYFECFYNLLNKFIVFKNHISNISKFNVSIKNIPDIDIKETWQSVFLDGKSLFFTLKSKSQSQNRYSQKLEDIEKLFELAFGANTYNVFNKQIPLTEFELLNSFRTQAFQIGYVQAFWDYCHIAMNVDLATVSSVELLNYSDIFLEKVNLIEKEEWANIFQFVREVHVEMHPKCFPVITQLILRRIQSKGEFFDLNDDTKYLAPECLLFFNRSVSAINEIIDGQFGAVAIKSMKLDDLLQMPYGTGTYKDAFDMKIQDQKRYVAVIFRDYLKIPDIYLDSLFNILNDEIYTNLKVKK
jgi:hypothetical protein